VTCAIHCSSSQESLRSNWSRRIGGLKSGDFPQTDGDKRNEHAQVAPALQVRAQGRVGLEDLRERRVLSFSRVTASFFPMRRTLFAMAAVPFISCTGNTADKPLPKVETVSFSQQGETLFIEARAWGLAG